MKIYLVGGAVRDKMLGFPVKERDFVVVGATSEEMLNLGFRKVGKEFPVFLHPDTHEEYALARMERKTGPGYSGFSFVTSPEVTLEEDLIRRDLTINAMAESENNDLIDPYHGRQDLAAKKLRHVSPAFAEDPVRILRLGRFLARFHHLGFTVAAETQKLMQDMVAAGEVDALVAERVWKEWARALGEPNPEQFFQVLSDAHAISILFPAINLNGFGLQALMQAAKDQQNILVRFAALLHDLDASAITTLTECYRVPKDYRTLALMAAEHHQAILTAKNANPEALLELFTRCDIFRRMTRFQELLCAVISIAKVRNLPFDSTWLETVARKTQIESSMYIQTLIARGFQGADLIEPLRQFRLEIIKKNI